MQCLSCGNKVNKLITISILIVNKRKKTEHKMSVLVGRAAPDFTAAAVLGSGEIVDSFNFKRCH